MAAQVGDIYQAVASGVYLGQAVTNVYWYKLIVNNGSPARAGVLSNRIADTLLPQVAAIQNDQMLWTGVNVINYRDPADSFLESVNVSGVLPTANNVALPSYMALAFRYQRVASGQRYGYKRFCGLNEGQVDGNTVTINQALLDDVRGMLARNLTSANSDTQFKPVVVKRPVTLGANPISYEPSSVRFNGLTTQNTRKP